jgi:hypothetical protein
MKMIIRKFSGSKRLVSKKYQAGHGKFRNAAEKT